jgi:hypothetical protein
MVHLIDFAAYMRCPSESTWLQHAQARAKGLFPIKTSTASFNEKGLCRLPAEAFLLE